MEEARAQQPGPGGAPDLSDTPPPGRLYLPASFRHSRHRARHLDKHETRRLYLEHAFPRLCLYLHLVSPIPLMLSFTCSTLKHGRDLYPGLPEITASPVLTHVTPRSIDSDITKSLPWVWVDVFNLVLQDTGNWLHVNLSEV